MHKIEVLQAARKLITDPKKWCKGRFVARNPYTAELSYCAVGAINNAVSYGAHSQEAVNALTSTVGHVINFNDSFNRTHDEVLDAFDRTIAREYMQSVGRCIAASQGKP